MKTANDFQNSRYNDPLWYFLAEYSLAELLVDGEIGDGLAAKLLTQTIQDLGIPPQCLLNIARTLAGFVEEARLHSDHGRLESPVRIRLFCQKKMIGAEAIEETSGHLNAAQATEPACMLHHSVSKKNGGWGFFLVERGGAISAGDSGCAQYLVDLYIYKEGE